MNREERIPTWLGLVLAATCLVTTAVRVAPLVEGGDRLTRQCVTEDGYLMLTIARNISLGNGFSVSAGSVATNGTQPLCTLFFALCFFAVGGDRFIGLYPVVGLQFLWSVVTAFAVFICTKRVLYRGSQRRTVAVLAGVLWYVSPTSVMHSQNGLETGLASLFVLAGASLYAVFLPRLRERFYFGRCSLLGVVLGLAFLVRNDACLLIAFLLIFHLVVAGCGKFAVRGLKQALFIGALSIMVASPWLWYNVSRFGHVVPVSGRAEAMGAEFGYNFFPALAAMFENVMLVLRIPASLEASAAVQGVSGIALLALAVMVCRYRNWFSGNFSSGLSLLAGFVGALFIFYSLFFGVPTFLGRYFFPMTLIVSIVGAALFVRVHSSKQPLIRAGSVCSVMVACLCCVVLNTRIYAKGEEHLHFQVVDWVGQHVPDSTWVAATQTGTLGYYHDRTINLDGKVDPNALAARMSGSITDYIDLRNVAYIVDWVGHAEWADRPEFAANFELLVNDPVANLAVLQRRQERLGAVQ